MLVPVFPGGSPRPPYPTGPDINTLMAEQGVGTDRWGGNRVGEKSLALEAFLQFTQDFRCTNYSFQEKKSKLNLDSFLYF